MSNIDLTKNEFLYKLYNSLSVQTLEELHKATGDRFIIEDGRITEVVVNETKAL